jgi:hypothetical protein
VAKKAVSEGVRPVRVEGGRGREEDDMVVRERAHASGLRGECVALR